jgi:yecA family protein
MEFDALDHSLAQAGAHAGAAECHGALAGWLASGQGADPEPWLDPMLEELDRADAKVERCRKDLLVLHRQVADQLASAELGFTPLLPADETPLATRVGALAEWCEGFLFGLGLAGAAATRGGEEVREVIGDFSQIARAGMETGEGDEDDEVAYAELVEYLKVGAQTVHDGLQPVRPRRLH